MIIDELRKNIEKALHGFVKVEVPAATIVMVVIAVVVVAVVLVVTAVIRVCSGRFEGHRDPRPASKFLMRSAVLPL
jgi:hypothetical protein